MDQKVSRKDYVHQEIKENFTRGGHRARFMWFSRWFHLGSGNIGFLKWLMLFFGLVVDTAFLLHLGILYVILALFVGFIYDWYDFTIISQTQANILNPDLFERIRKKIQSAD